MTILEVIKESLEVDIEEEIYDTQLLIYLNSAIRYLINNNIPLITIEQNTKIDEWSELKEGDSHVVFAWLQLYVLQRFDRTLMQGNQSTTATWIDREMTDLIYQLKCIYDRSDRT